MGGVCSQKVLEDLLEKTAQVTQFLCLNKRFPINFLQYACSHMCAHTQLLVWELAHSIKEAQQPLRGCFVYRLESQASRRHAQFQVREAGEVTLIRPRSEVQE